MSFVGSSTRGGVSSTQIVLQCPSGVQAGDFMFAAIFMRGVAAGISAPAGWTVIRSQATPDSNNLLIVYWKAASSSEPASYTWTASASGYHSATLTALRGPSGVAGSDSLGQLSSSTHGVDAPSVSASSGEVLICAWAVNQSGTVASWTPPSGMSETADSDSSYSTTSAAMLTVGATGSTGVKTASYSAGNTSAQAAGMSVRLITNQAPNAPTLALPDGTVLDRNSTNRLPWTFSDPDVGDSQSAANLRYRLTGSGTWTTVNVPNPNNFWDAVAGTFTAGDYEWQVQTADQSGAWGPYSGSGFFTVADAPNPPTWLDPISGQTIGLSSYTGIISAPNVDQSEWTLYADNAGAIGTTILQGPVTITPADGDVRRHTFTGLANNTPVWWSVRIKDNGLWSQPAQIRTPVSYTPPTAPVVTLTPDPANGTLTVGITNPAPGAGEPATSYNNVYVDDGKGKGKERVATNLPTNQPWTYPWPVSLRDYTGNLWVEAVATNGTTAETVA